MQKALKIELNAVKFSYGSPKGSLMYFFCRNAIPASDKKNYGVQIGEETYIILMVQPVLGGSAFALEII